MTTTGIAIPYKESRAVGPKTRCDRNYYTPKHAPKPVSCNMLLAGEIHMREMIVCNIEVRAAVAVGCSWSISSDV